jgi:hypothetical protein
MFNLIESLVMGSLVMVFLILLAIIVIGYKDAVRDIKKKYGIDVRSKSK